MIANNLNENDRIASYLDQEIQLYKSGEMPNDIIRYQLFIMCANHLIKYDKFYQELSVDQINEYFKEVTIFDTKEVSIIIKKINQISDTDEDANLLMQQIMPNVLCPLKKSKSVSFISPCCSQELYNTVTGANSCRECGKSKPANIFDFNSDENIQLRETQERSTIEAKYQHSKEISTLIIEHSLDDFINQPIQNYNNYIVEFKKVPKKPFFWEKNIFKTAINGDAKSFKYNIYNLPLLRDIKNEKGETLGHLASKSGNSSIISALIEMNSDLNEADNEGNLPIHCVLNQKTLNAFIVGGYSYETANKSGELLIEIKSHPFNSKVIERLIQLGINILIPNDKGIYWMQYVINNSYYPSDNQYVEFQKFVRKIIQETDFPFYKDNEVIQKVLQRDAEVSEIYDSVDLRNAVTNEDIEQIKSLMAIGTIADNKMYNRTNLMIASELGNIDIVRILATNYCNPNITNHKGENSFWLASQSKHFDVATLLLNEFDANPNIVSKSGQTLLHIAYNEGIEDLFNFLLESGASPNVKNRENQTVQFIAFLNKDDETAEKIQNDYNGDININGKDGNSLGHLALINNDLKRLDYLFERKLNVNVKNDSGQSLFMWTILNTNNLNLCQKLLKLGANIDDQDNKGNTSFYYICTNSHFSEEKFQFLIENNCNINIQNKNHDFPISQLILNGKTNEILLLLNKGSNIVDPESSNEPIVLALKMHNELLINKFIENNANAMNKTYPVVEKYIKEPFFNLEKLKKMKKYNLCIGCPFQSALQKSNDAAVFLWNLATKEERIKISNSVDENGYTPLIAAINANNEFLFNNLIDDKYNITKSDLQWRTPFMHCCILNNTDFINKLYHKLSTEEINKTDKERNSALTYICNNNNRQMADLMFIDNIYLGGINLDNNGIIQFYIDRIKHIEELKCSTCNKIYVKTNEIRKCESDLRSLKANEFFDKFSMAPTQGENESYNNYQARFTEWSRAYSNETNKRDQMMRELQSRVNNLDDDVKTAKIILDKLRNATRKKILYDYDYLTSQSKFAKPKIAD